MDKGFLPTDKVLVLDFDHTCYDTDAFLLFEIRNRMIDTFNIPIDAWEEAYEASAQIGYSLERHREELIKILKKELFSVEEIQKFEKEIDFSKYLYPDTIKFVKKAKEEGYKIMLLSFGETKWQDKKVKGCGFDKYMDVIKYTREAGGKMGVLREYTENCKRVLFVENNGRDIDNVRRFLPYVETYFMNRVPPKGASDEDEEFIKVRYSESRKIAERKTKLNHKPCQTFDDVDL